MHRVEKEGGHLLEKKYFKSQLSLLHNPPPPLTTSVWHSGAPGSHIPPRWE